MNLSFSMFWAAVLFLCERGCGFVSGESMAGYACDVCY